MVLFASGRPRRGRRMDNHPPVQRGGDGVSARRALSLARNPIRPPRRSHPPMVISPGLGATGSGVRRNWRKGPG